MALSFIALILLAVLGLVVVGGIVALCHRRTRWLGLFLLTVPVVLGCLAFAGLLFSRVQHHQAAINTYPPPQVQEIPLPSTTIRQHGTLKTPPAPLKPAAPKQLAGKTLAPLKTETPPKKSGRVVEAISTALGQALIDLSNPRGKVATNTANKKTDDKKADNTKTDDEKAADKENADQIGKMVEVLSSAVQEELPADVEVDQFTALRALGKLLGRMIASEQQEAQAVAEGADATKAADDAKPASGLKEQKTSAVAASAEKAGASNAKGPDWVDAPPQRVGDGYQVVFAVGPYTTRLECEQEMNQQLARAVAEYAVLYFGSPDGAKATLPTSFLREHVVKDQWEEIFRSSFGPMVRLHARLVFDGKTNAELKADYRRATIEERLWMAGGGLGVILIALAGCFAVLKFDQATEGEYRGRMIFTVFFAVVMATSVLGTRYLISMRPANAPASAENIHQISTDRVAAEPIAKPSNANVGSPNRLKPAYVLQPVHAQISSKLSFMSLFVLALPTCAVVSMLFFRKTRKIAVILLSLGVVLVVGALFLVA